MENNKIVFINNRAESQRGVQLCDGRIISLFDENNKFYLRFDYPLNLENGTFVAGEGSSDSVTLNRLLREGQAKEVHCYDSMDYNMDIYPYEWEETDITSNEIVEFFKGKGFNVTITAVEHQLNAWLGDMKSGYRDDANGYHLFSPCGCNPLSIRLTTLHPLCCDWQITYEC